MSQRMSGSVNIMDSPFPLCPPVQIRLGDPASERAACAIRCPETAFFEMHTRPATSVGSGAHPVEASVTLSGSIQNRLAVHVRTAHELLILLKEHGQAFLICRADISSGPCRAAVGERRRRINRCFR